MSVAAVDLLPTASGQDPPPGPRRRRWPWRSPEGQPAWARPALLGIAAVAALLYAWNISSAGLPPFYSVAVRSMSESWRAFIFGAFDPKATITIDKLAGAFLPQALSARIFGFHAWSLALPQVIEGVICVLVMYRVVRRWAGVVPGMLAAGIFALTPVAASMFGHSMEDGALTMCLVLAADACQRAVTEGRLRSLIWSGVWVGLGFQAKMMQAWMVLPALAISYLLTAPPPLRRRLRDLAIAGAVMLAVSLSWIALYTFTPAADRPYIDGSTNNSAIAMVFGYNGLGRFGIEIPGAIPADNSPVPLPDQAVPGTPQSPGAATAGPEASSSGPGLAAGFNLGTGGGWTKLAGSRFGPEIGWLYPLALAALILGISWSRTARRTDQLRGGFVMWGTWLLTFGLIFSDMSVIPHTAYVASLAPPLAALSAVGTVMFWRLQRAGGPHSWLLPAAAAAELAWAFYLWRGYRSFLPWVLPVTVAVGVAGIAVLAATRLSPRVPRRLVVPALSLSVAAMFLPSAAWAASVLDASYAGTAIDASAGPSQTISQLPHGLASPGAGLSEAGLAGTLSSLTEQLGPPGQRIYRYVTVHRGGAAYLMAVSSWFQGSPYILTTGQEVLPMGGFTGSVPEPTLTRIKQLVSSGQLRFFLLGGPSLRQIAGAAAAGSPQQAIVAWVQKTCAEVPPAAYGAAPSPPTGAVPPAGGGASVRGTLSKLILGSQTLYECGTRTQRRAAP
jgi:4-amino-4-deoxy-L-arabinose transferase-like glycosyltransferase